MTAFKNNIPQTEIAQTLRDIAAFAKAKNIGPAHNEMCDEWLAPGGLPDQVATMSQQQLDTIFDDAHYWPREIRPILIDFARTLKFFAKHEKLNSQPPVAEALMDRIDAFEGRWGSCHAAITDMYREAGDYISAQPRHPSEKFEYVPSGKDISDDPNVDLARGDWLRNRFMPEGDADGHVVVRMEMGGDDEKKLDRLTWYKELFDVALSGLGIAAGDFSATITLGKTYGEDAVTVRVRRQAYEDILVPHLANTGHNSDGIYDGYRQGSLAFRGPHASERGETVYLHNSQLAEAESDIAAGRATPLGNAVRFLRAAGLVREDDVPELEMKSFSSGWVSSKDEPYFVEGRYYSSTDMSNSINANLRHIAKFMNGGPAEMAVSEDTRTATGVLEHDGKIYMAYNAGFKQLAYHFNYVAGVARNWGSCYNAPDAVKEAFGRDKNYLVLDASALPGANRRQVEGEIRRALKDVAFEISYGVAPLQAGLNYVASHSPDINRRILARKRHVLRDESARRQFRPE